MLIVSAITSRGKDEIVVSKNNDFLVDYVFFLHSNTHAQRKKIEDVIVHQTTYLLTVVDCWVLNRCQEDPSGSS